MMVSTVPLTNLQVFEISFLCPDLLKKRTDSGLEIYLKIH